MPKRWSWSIRSNAPARSASKTHRRLGLAPLATLKMAPIASWQPRPGRNPYDLGSNRASHSGSNAFTTRACNTLSRITGIPSGRRFPALPFLGIYTRLTGRACHGPVWRCTRSTSKALDSASNTTFPSTPAVARPALSSVTRRTLNSVLARERSINFCKLRTRLRSPTCDAVKIRCRKCRTSSSTARQSTACQSRGSSSGPFTTDRRTNPWTGTPLVGGPSRRTYGVCGSGSARACLSRMRGKRASPVLRAAGRSNAPGLPGELVGPYKNGGKEWHPAGDPEQVKVHDFIDPTLGKANPYGVYDLGADTGWVSVGTDHD